jgi:hypothetical protein
MLRIFAAPDVTRVHAIKDLLTRNEIPAVVRGDKPLENLHGHKSHKEVWPSVWLKDKTDVERAMKLLAEVNPRNELCNIAWTCKDCGAQNPAGTGLCHSCLEDQQWKAPGLNAAQRSALLLLKISAAFFAAFIIASNFVVPRLVGQAQHGTEFFAMLSCIASIVIAVWAMREYARDPA